VARSRASAIVRPPHGLHPLRHHRCRRAAELARATGATERRWHRAMAVSAERNRALRLLAGSPLGVTEAILLAHGFTRRKQSWYGCQQSNSTLYPHSDLVSLLPIKRGARCC
jgi:hypothetical protein